METVLFTFLYSTSKTKHTVQRRQKSIEIFLEVLIIEFVHVITTERFAYNNKFTHIKIGH